jgi:hypothetical protein
MSGELFIGASDPLMVFPMFLTAPVVRPRR